jgi:hypothetical protein
MARHPDFATPSADILRAVADPTEHTIRRGETGKGAALSPAEARARTEPAVRVSDVKPKMAAGSDDDGDDDGADGAAADGADDDLAAQRGIFDAYLGELEHHLAAVGIDVADTKWEKVSLPVTRFMNRVLGMPVHMQCKVFAHFSAQSDMLIKQAKEAGTYDDGVVDLCARVVRVRGEPQVVQTEKDSGAAARYIELELDRGMSWDAALRERDFRKSIAGAYNGADFGTDFFESYRFMPNTMPLRKSVHMFVRVPKPVNIAENLWVPVYREYLPHLYGSRPRRKARTRARPLALASSPPVNPPAS